jgi:MOSC domain-containing protein YiiM
MTARIIGLSATARHRFSKAPQLSLRLVAGLGVEGDAHFGETMKHRSRWAKNPRQPNTRQVHVIHAELFDELAAKGFALAPGEMGENVTTPGIDILALSAGTQLRLGAEAMIEVTGLRNPCIQMDRFAPGLMAATLDRTADGSPIRKAGIMAVVLQGGDVHCGDAVAIAWAPAQPVPLGVV